MNRIWLTVTLLLAFGLSSQALAQVSTRTVWVNGRAIVITTNRVGNSVFTSGTVAGTPFQSTTNRVGSFMYTNGTVGGTPYQSTSNRVGNSVYSNGPVFGCPTLPPLPSWP